MPLPPSPAQVVSRIHDRSDPESVCDALARANVNDLHGAAALMRVTEAEAATFITEHAALIAQAQARVKLRGEHLPVKAVAVIESALDRAREILNHPEGCDPSEIKALASIARGVLDDQTRRELAQQSAKDDRVVVDIVFENGSPIVHIVATEKPTEVIDVEDATPKTRQATDAATSVVVDIDPADYVALNAGGAHE